VVVWGETSKGAWFGSSRMDLEETTFFERSALIQLHNKERIQGRFLGRDIKTQDRSTTSRLGLPS